MGSLGVALGSMVANLSSHKRGWDDRWEEFSELAEKGKDIQNRLLLLVDEDTRAFNMIMEAFGLPKSTDLELKHRKDKIDEATRYAINVPLKVMETAYEGFDLIKHMVSQGNPNSITDGAVGALAIRSCIKGAFLNVRINASGLDDKKFVEPILNKGAEIESSAEKEEAEILKLVESKM